MEKQKVAYLIIAICGLLALICYLLARVGVIFSILAISFLSIFFASLTYISFVKNKEYKNELTDKKAEIIEKKQQENKNVNIKRLNTEMNFSKFNNSLYYLIFGFCSLLCLYILIRYFF